MTLFTVACVLLPACGSVLPEPKAAPQPDAAFEEVAFSPPPARIERVPAAPSAESVWLDGEWRWDGSRWAWETGRWTVLPAGVGFARWAARRREDGVLLVAPGSFRDAAGREVAPPRSLALGRARDDTVVDAEGNRENTAPNVPPEEGVPRPR